jgi:hypothetical protein
MSLKYEIEEIRSPQGISRFPVRIRWPRLSNRPAFEERIGLPGSRLPPDFTPGFWSIAEAQNFIEGHKAANKT